MGRGRRQVANEASEDHRVELVRCKGVTEQGSFDTRVFLGLLEIEIGSQLGGNAAGGALVSHALNNCEHLAIELRVVRNGFGCVDLLALDLLTNLVYLFAGLDGCFKALTDTVGDLIHGIGLDDS